MSASKHYEITLVQSQERFLCGNDQAVLNAMAALGRKSIPSGCHGGGCGVCRVRIVSGQCSYLPMSRAHISEDDENNGLGLACRIFPETDIELEVLEKLKTRVLPFHQANRN